MTRIGKPPTYNRDEYLSLIDDVRLNRFAGPPEANGIRRHRRDNQYGARAQ